MLLKLLILFIVLPLLDLWLLFTLADSLVSFGITIGLVVATGIIGASLAKRQGLAAWKNFNAELGRGASYVFIRGADTQRPSSVYAVTRNWSGNYLNQGKWCGSDSDIGNGRTMSGLTASQGQSVTMDGGSRQSTNADFQAQGTMVKAAYTATGGCAKGRTSIRIIRGAGL